MMQTFQGGAALRWARPKRSELRYELHAGEAVVATLAWARGSRAIGQWAEACYWFNRQGWFRPRTVVRSAAGEAAEQEEQAEIVATFAHRGGILSFPDGRTLLWKRPRRWTNERIWADSAGREIARFHPVAWGTATTLTIQQALASAPELPLLAMLGQYLIVLDAQEAAVAASSAATAAIIASS